MTSEHLENHKIWSAMANKKLKSIYNQLCELESFPFSEDNEDAPKLLELLEIIDEIQGHHHAVVETIVSTKDSLTDKRTDLQMQLKLLEKSIELLKLETNWKEQQDEENEANS